MIPRILAGFALVCCMLTPVIAQQPDWQRLSAAHDVDTMQIRWLQTNLTPVEASTVLARVNALSKPAVAQMLPTFFYLDGRILSRSGKAYADSFMVRPGDDTAGIVRVAYFAAKMRHALLDAYKSTTYSASFDDRPIVIPGYVNISAAAAQRVAHTGIKLGFDFGPADTLMAIVSTPDISQAEVLPRISTHPFDALIQHHSQSFYPIPLSRELLAANLAAAASNRPLDQLYAYANPMGLLHYVDVRNNRVQYRMLLDTLKQHEPQIVQYIASKVADYMPADLELTRNVSFFFVDWSDGWGASDVTAVDLEYYKGDVDRLINTQLHETFHAAQHSVTSARGWRKANIASAADSALDEAATDLIIEGTANFVAPTVTRTAASADSMAQRGEALLEQLVALAKAPQYDRARARKILDEGVSGGGPFYWLGSAMAKTIVDQLGARALAETFRKDGIEYVRTYEKAKGSRLNADVRQAFGQLKSMG